MTTPIKPAADARGGRPKSPRPLKALLPRLRPYSGRLAVSAFCLVIAAAVGLAFPQVVRKLLDAAFQQHDRALLDRIAIGLVLAFLLQGVMNFIQVYLLTGTSERVVAKLREDVFAHLIRLSPGFFTERRTGELTSRLSADLAVLQSLLASNISELSRQTLFLVGGIVMLSLTHPHLTTTTLAGVPVVVGSAFFFGRRLRRASTGVQDR
ncbi:MAG: ABC transporter transmembrane domain-containing protein, partial [bacterium]